MTFENEAQTSLPPIVMWHYRGDPENIRRQNATTAHISRTLRHTMIQAVESTVAAAAHAADMPINSNWTLARYLADTDVPDVQHWTAYTCPREASGRTNDLIRLVYGVWLNLYGDHKLFHTTSKQIRRELDSIYRVKAEQIDTVAILGRLVVPDLANGVFPGTDWRPNRATMMVPALPRKPDTSVS